MQAITCSEARNNLAPHLDRVAKDFNDCAFTGQSKHAYL